MIRAFTLSGLTAIAIALAPFGASQAKADDDFAKFLAGIATVAVIGAIIADSDDHNTTVSSGHNHGSHYAKYGHYASVHKRHAHKHRKHAHKHKYKHSKQAHKIAKHKNKNPFKNHRHKNGVVHKH
ncbi:MAG: hypothetical protein GY947_09195 [Rhodobacteraceae bacterium]|nr:hypothetical protein [Paracoccaceae bacterium]